MNKQYYNILYYSILVVFLVFHNHIPEIYATSRRSAIRYYSYTSFQKLHKKINLPQKYPSKAKKIQYKFPHMKLTIYGLSFTQGNLAQCKIQKTDTRIKISKITFANNIDVNFFEHNNNIYCFFPISIKADPNNNIFQIAYQIIQHSKHSKYSPHPLNKTASIEVPFKKTQWEISKNKLNLSQYSNVQTYQNKKNQKMIIKFQKEKKKILATLTDNKLTHHRGHPRGTLHQETSGFGKIRKTIYYDKSKNKTFTKERIHRGLDFKGQVGTPIYSMAHGKVILAKQMFYEGGFIVIDHGNNLLSGYMHLNKIKVQKGEKVKAGQYIGNVGQTGAVTGAHLHTFIYLQGYYLNPMSFLGLPLITI